nr:MAG TPA: hypothetical protein [Caudoviricetes sp.]
MGGGNGSYTTSSLYYNILKTNSANKTNKHYFSSINR